MLRHLFYLFVLAPICSLGWSLPMGFAAAPILQKDSAALYAAWAKTNVPTSGPQEPIGTYAAGCLVGALPVPADANGYAAMRLRRQRLFGHSLMLDYLRDLSERLRSSKMPLLLVGDVGPARGGPMSSGHNSHQIGLDVDLWLRMSTRRPTRSQRESWAAPSFVIHRKKLKRTWSATQVNLVTAAANSPLVARVFVSPAIKRYFCNLFPQEPWQARLRAWWGHEEHIHVRLTCPTDATQCVNQAPPLDNGCGTELDWWFSKEADDDWTKLLGDKSPRTFPDLPPACAEMPTRP